MGGGAWICGGRVAVTKAGLRPPLRGGCGVGRLPVGRCWWKAVSGPSASLGKTGCGRAGCQFVEWVVVVPKGAPRPGPHRGCRIKSGKSRERVVWGTALVVDDGFSGPSASLGMTVKGLGKTVVGAWGCGERARVVVVPGGAAPRSPQWIPDRVRQVAGGGRVCGGIVGHVGQSQVPRLRSGYSPLGFGMGFT